MISERLERLESALARIRSGDPVIETDRIPIRLINTSNSRKSWHDRARRAKVARSAAAMQVRSEISCLVLAGDLMSARLVVRLVYIGPRALDDDGLASATKSLRDGVADALGIDDRDPRVVWVPDQERGGVREYGARVEIYLA